MQVKQSALQVTYKTTKTFEHNSLLHSAQ